MALLAKVWQRRSRVRGGIMSRKQLAALFICQLIPYAVANGLLSLLPIYVKRFDASATVTGFYLALTFVGLSVGSLYSGRLSNRFRQHKSFIIGGAIFSAVTTFLMGVAPDMPLLMLFTALAWLAAGIQIAMVNILTGLFADKRTRGKTFGIIGIAPVVGGMLGGLSAGPIVDQLGFFALFALNGLAYMVVVLAALWLEDKAPAAAPAQATHSANARRVSRPLLLLFTASVLVSVANYITGLGRPLAMNALNFDSTAISSTIAISSAATLPVPFILGWLSDRIGRKRLLIACYLAIAAGVGVLSGSSLIWHFWLSQSLISWIRSERSLSSAYATDLIPPQSLSSNLAQLSTAPWIGAVIGYAVGGIALQTFGIVPTLTLTALLPLASVALVSIIRPTSNQAVTVEVTRPAAITISHSAIRPS
jgi:MFS family permease